MQRSTLLMTLVFAACASRPTAPESRQLPAAITAAHQPASIPDPTSTVVAVEHVDAGVQQDAAASKDSVETPREILTRRLAVWGSWRKGDPQTYVKFLVGGVDLCAFVRLERKWLTMVVVHPQLPTFRVGVRDVGGGQLETKGFSYTLGYTRFTWPSCRYPLAVKSDPPSIDGARIYASEEECLQDTASWALGLPYPERPQVKRPIPAGNISCWPWVAAAMDGLRDPNRGKVDLTDYP